MACYMGCKTCAGKMRWLLFMLFAIVAAACLAAGIVKSVPGLTVLFQCTTKDKSIQESGACWKDFWKGYSVPFIVACIGLGALLMTFLTCCCFVCASGPGAKKGKKQFQQGEYDTNAYGDQRA